MCWEPILATLCFHDIVNHSKKQQHVSDPHSLEQKVNSFALKQENDSLYEGVAQ